MPTITEFLEARIADDEAEAKDLQGEMDFGLEACGDRMLAECAAKLAIIKLADDVESMDYQISNEWGGDIDGTGDLILRNLAAVYKDHPDYQQEWAL